MTRGKVPLLDFPFLLENPLYIPEAGVAQSFLEQPPHVIPMLHDSCLLCKEC